MALRNETSTILADSAAQLHQAVLDIFRCLRITRPTGALGMSKLGVLGFLHRCGDTTAAALAAHLQVQPQSMTRLLADLEERGLIVRRPDTMDRRRNQIAITPAGVDLLLKDVLGQRLKLADTMRTMLTPTEQDLLLLAADLMSRLAKSVETECVQKKAGMNEPRH
jgi:DNA-binding MarR family transcriptional regulator